MHPFSKSWDEVARRFCEIRDHYRRMAPMATRMLELVAGLRRDARFEHLSRWVSHVSLIISDADRCVAIAYSDPGGYAWAGEEGFYVYRVDFREMKSWSQVIVPEDGVTAAVLERLEREVVAT